MSIARTKGTIALLLRPATETAYGETGAMAVLVRFLGSPKASIEGRPFKGLRHSAERMQFFATNDERRMALVKSPTHSASPALGSSKQMSWS
ncbi:MAG TPA: hypothetical protein V6D17_00810 [Candidatus Obscuribacterales bacterium]